MRTAMGVWRWRRNPLRRPTDLFEAWVAFAALVCVVVVAPAVGWVAGLRVDGTLQQAAYEQRQERHLVPAVVVRPAPAPDEEVAVDPPAERTAPRRTQIVASWTAPDGSSHEGTVPAAEEPPHPGDRFRIWTDARGRLVGQPLDPSAASFHAGTAGLAAAAGVAVMAVTVRRLVVRRLMHRRYIRLDRAWAAAGPDWGRADAGG
ncbi:Rv1733c family protein [Streptomyces erythrochromogenes]|uniref:Rv1733c family protein n=1 Tax=Streptomyces erythrochromogenes TaxID=285574 RepID=UPI00382A6460